MTRFLLAALAVVLTLSPALAETQHFHADMNAEGEVPPTVSPAIGTADATLDTATGKLTWTLTWKDFIKPPTMAHFHGPAAVGKNADVALPLGVNPTSPLTGTAVLKPAQISDLEAGLWYANVHTAHFPKGAIRGQMLKAK